MKEIKDIIKMLERNGAYSLDTELTPEFDGAKSFYRKATVKSYQLVDNKLVKVLYSYNSLVCMIVYDILTQTRQVMFNHDVELLTSHTTTRHCKEFVKQNVPSVNHLTKAEMFGLENEVLN